MNLAIIGYGSMGRQIKEIAEQRGHTVVSIVDPQAEGATHTTLTAEALSSVDVAIDFTHPRVILAHIDTYCATQTNVVVGTTGWYDHLDKVQQHVEKAGIGFLWGSNFSIGVQMYFKIIEEAAKLVNTVEEYDIWGTELHHHNKADSPSGTAKTLAKILIKEIDRKKKATYEMLNRKIEPDEIHFSSTRGGSVNFSHTVGFDSAADTITLTHTARNREGYVLGAVKAAEWLHNKKGFYNFKELL